MDFDLSADQQALRSAAGVLLRRVLPIERVRAVVGKAEDARPLCRLDDQLWQAMAEQGWLAIEQDETVGGLGLGAVEVAVLCEEASRCLAPVPYAETVLCLGALRDGARRLPGVEPDPGRSTPAPGVEPAPRGSTPAPGVEPDPGRCTTGPLRTGSGPHGVGTAPSGARAPIDTASGWWRYALERLADGRGAGCVAWTPAPDSIEVVSYGEQCELSGRAELVLWGPVAEVMVVVGGDGVYAVDLSDGRAPTAQPAMDRTRSVGWAVMDRVPATKIGGREAVIRVVDRAATFAAAQLLGVAGRVLEMSVEYARSREQFGRAIGSFQAVKHRLADALVDVEAMRSSVYYAAWCLAAGDVNASLAASMAKAWCSEAAMRVVASGLQVHGGIGFTWEHDLHLYVKRAQLDATVFGSATWHRERIAGFLHERSDDPTTLF